MHDLIERLRNPMWIHSHISVSATAELDEDQTVADLKDAADEIERLRDDRKTYDAWAEEIKLNVSQMRTFIEFVFLWSTRDNVTDAERISVIKNHPFLQEIIKGRATHTSGDHQ